MKKKISVIIPNYNNGKYIEKCLNSVIEQTYNNFEIILIDDGSTDNSMELAEKLLKNNKHDYKIIEQFNQNASIARNRGIESASGDFAFFLDSDDIIFSNDVFQKLIDCSKNYDLVIGNYEVINEQDEKIDLYDAANDINEFKGVYKYCNLSPNPSNKFYNMNLIKSNNLYFSNVRIGQDLNFYLKYLALCKKVNLVNFNVYKYRNFQQNMSNAKNLRIFDIYESINEVKKFYKNINKYDEYRKYITSSALKNYHVQMAKVHKFNDRKIRKLIYRYFEYCVYENSKDAIKNNVYKNEYKKYLVKKILLKLNLYGLYKKVK